MARRRTTDQIAADIRRTGRTVARGDEARPRLVDLYVEGARAGLTPAEMADLAGVEPGTVRGVLTAQRKAGAEIPAGRRGPRSGA